MRQVAEIIINETNLTAFLPQTELKEQDVATKFYHLRKIDFIEIKESREIIEITIESRSFFRHLVRSIVGAMIWVAIEKISIADFRSRIGNYRIDKNGNKAMLNGRSDQDISPIAPPYGLFFTDVKY
jgi:tRNA pseudouridine(38-40) synthase